MAPFAFPRFALVVLALAFGLPTLLVMELDWFRFQPQLIAVGFILAWSSVRLGIVSASGDARPIAITFWVFVYIWFGLSPLLQIGFGLYPLWLVHTPASESLAGAVALTGIGAFELGAWAARRRERSRGTGSRAAPVLMSDRRLVIICAACVAMALLSIVVLGGPFKLIGSRAQVGQVFYGGSSIMARMFSEATLRPPAFVATLALSFWLAFRWRLLDRQRRYQLLALLAAALPVMLVANWPNAQTRFWLGTIVLAGAFALAPWRRWMPAALILGLVFGLIVIFPTLDMNRSKSYEFDQQVQGYYLPQTLADPIVTKYDYDVFQQLCNSTVYVESQGYMQGRNLLGASLFWVPRKLWKDKPIGSGYIVALSFAYPHVNLSASLWMEGFLAFGVFGTALLLAVYGFIAETADRRYAAAVASGTTAAVVRLMVPLWAGYQIYFLRGDLISAIAFSSTMMVLCAALGHWLRRNAGATGNSGAIRAPHVPQRPLRQPLGATP